MNFDIFNAYGIEIFYENYGIIVQSLCKTEAVSLISSLNYVNITFGTCLEKIEAIDENFELNFKIF